MTADFSGRVVLITGGTMGIGLETALAFASRGASCVLTYKWGSADEESVRTRFRQVGASEPLLFQADAGHQPDTLRLMHRIQSRHSGVDVLVSNVTVGLMVPDLDAYRLRSLLKTIELSAWPLVDYTLKINQIFGKYPRYVIGLSSDGPDTYAQGYDFVAAAKSVMETLIRYLNHRLHEKDVRVNAVRTRGVSTASFRDAFGIEFEAFQDRLVPQKYRTRADQVAEAVVALCCGLFDGVGGQVLTIDRGTGFFDDLMRIYEERHDLDL